MNERSLKGSYWTHRKDPKKVYRVDAEGTLQLEGAFDMQPIVIYRDSENKTWVRLRSEFLDGRFTEFQ